jgi:DNA-binding CsgD family transcriptional regulator/tetratricopeptide (TPR) repeat protein
MISSPLASTTFVGRAEERSFLLERFAAARAGVLSAVVVEGDSGIGKTRLLEELRAAIVAEAGFGLGCCLEYARAPYQPFNDIFGQLGRDFPIAARSSERDVISEEKLAHFSSIAAALAKYATRRPLVIVIEDIQWADDATIELVQYICRSLRNERIALFLTVATDALRQQPNLGVFVARLLRLGASHVRLGPLRREDVRVMVAGALGGRAEYSADLLARIEDASDGNPLFVEELLRTALEKHAGNGLTVSEIPLTIRAMLWERIVPLSNKDRDILVHAAVIGRSFDADFLASITGQSRKQVLDVLQRARALQLLVDQPGNPPTYKFRHALLRETFYRELLPDVAGPLHARIAAKLEELPNADSLLAERAYHWTVAGIEEKAIECNERAGDAAAAVYAFSDAIRFYRQALQFRYPSGFRRAQLYERFGRLLFHEGRESEPRVWLEKALEEYKRLGDHEGLARVFLDSANQCWLDGQTERSIEVALPAVNMLLTEQPESQLLALARTTLARYYVTLGHADDAMQQLHAVLPETLVGDDELTAAFWEIKGETEAALGRSAEAMHCYTEALRAADQNADSQSIIRIENSCGLSATDLGEFEVARAHFERSLNLASQHALTWRHAYASANYAMNSLLLADFSEARRYVASALTAPMNGPLRMSIAVVGIPLSLALGDDVLLERTADERVLEEAFRSGEAQRIGAASAAFAQLFAARGAAADATALLTKAVRALPRIHRRSWLLPFEVAKSCDEPEVERILELLALFGPESPIASAHIGLVKAVWLQRTGTRTAERVARARTAAEAFAILGWRLHEMIARDVAGESRPVVPSRGLDVKDVRGAGIDASSPLTKRQTEVATLIARGHSNQQIATALCISENTVEHHISEIYGRLGVTSRSQLIAGMAARA